VPRWLAGFWLGLLLAATPAVTATAAHADAVSFPPPLESYGDSHLSSVRDVLIHRVKQEPFNLEKAVGTAKYANHAKPERIVEKCGFTQRENALFNSTSSHFAYFAYFAV